MPPFLIAFVLLLTFLPDEIKYYSVSALIVFWIVYYIWDYYAKENKWNKKDTSI